MLTQLDWTLCLYCRLAVKGHAALIEHVNAKHPFPCHHPKCRQAFLSANELDAHESDRHDLEVEVKAESHGMLHL
jgi:hypothetical protein